MPGTALNTLPSLGYLIFSAPAHRGCYYPTHFTSEETEAQRGAGACPGPTAGEGGAETRVLVQPGPYFPLTRVHFLLQPVAWREQDMNDGEGLEGW